LTPSETSHSAPTLPLVGRGEELKVLRRTLDGVEEGSGTTVLLRGPLGSGRTRLCSVIRDEAERRGFLAAAGRAFPLESGVPYSPFCDLLDPLLRGESPDRLTLLTRGAPEFGLLSPILALPGTDLPGSVLAGDGPDLRNRLLWNLPGFLDRLRGDRPLVLILEDLESADPSSLELIHFLARRIREMPVALVLTLGERGAGDEPAKAIASLAESSGALLLEPGPLSADEVVQGVSDAFAVDPEVVRPLASSLHHWTGGSPLFLKATLDYLVSSGRIHREGESWTGWTVHALSGMDPPASVRHLIQARLDPLASETRELADLVAVAGDRVGFPLLRKVSELPEGSLFGALGELRRAGILTEAEEGDEVVYRFRHPVLRDVVYGGVGLARARSLHGRVARGMEDLHGDDALRHADRLAVHIVKAGPEVAPDRGAEILAAAGDQALGGQSNREAAAYYRAALDLLAGSEGGGPARLSLLRRLARALHRLGRFDEARDLLEEARREAASTGDREGEARALRRLSLGAFWAGEPETALKYWSQGLEAARDAGSLSLEARMLLASSACLQEMSRHEDAVESAETALRLGEDADNDLLRLAAHRSLLLLHTWSGPPEKAREHGAASAELASRIGDPVLEFSVEWAMAVLEGLTGRAVEMGEHMDRASTIVDHLGSPLLRLQLAELEIESAAGCGEWDRAMDLARESVRMARELNQRLALPRLLVACGLIHLGRGEIDEARACVDEAWELAGADRKSGWQATHLRILAHAGRAALFSSLGRWEEAIETGEAGMALADRGGYVAWGFYRILPIIAEASLHLRDLDRARRTVDRLRADAERFDHRLGRAWADAGDGLIAWLSGDVEKGAEQMAEAARRLEEIDSIPDAARLRRQVAGRLAELGDRDAAIRELRRVHDILASIGAEPELDKARGQFREVGARPPSRSGARGDGILTPREMEIARLVGERKSNKKIGKELGISPRTVGTHLSNIFRKFAVESRAELGDLVRDGGLEG
jgi:DNA-binding CsgD family transcriptional regulator/tetratricopeptide (TPR) repeat protein/DNA-binding transcriptional ArsR family regulator